VSDGDRIDYIPFTQDLYSIGLPMRKGRPRLGTRPSPSPSITRIALVGATALLIAVSAGAVAAGAQTTQAQLEFVAPEEIATSGSEGMSDPVSVWIKSSADRDLTPNFTASLEDGDGNAVAEGDFKVVAIVGDTEGPVGPLAADSVGRYRLALKGSGVGSAASGQLVATAPGVAPASVALAVAPKSIANHGVDGALFGPLAAAFVLMALVWLVRLGRVGLIEPLGPLDLDFKASFASTLPAFCPTRQ
jgi:hypothetical protein